MIDKILEFSIRQRVLVLMGALALLVGGIWSATKLPMDAIPDITGVQVQVNTTIPSLAPEEVENLVTFPLETALGGIAGVTEMRSLSRFGLSQVTLQFADKTDIYRARQLVAERLQGATDSHPLRSYTKARSEFNRARRSFLLLGRLRTRCARGTADA